MITPEHPQDGTSFHGSLEEITYPATGEFSLDVPAGRHTFKVAAWDKFLELEKTFDLKAGKNEQLILVWEKREE